jgi:hypothetical protein
MSKTTTDRSAKGRSFASRTETPIIPVKYQHAVAIGVLFVSLVIFFNQLVFNGKTFLGADTIAAHSWENVIKEAHDEAVFPLWNPYIFCGMPSFASLTYSGTRWYDISATLLGYVQTTLHYLFLAPPEGWVLGFYLIFGVGVYLLVYSKVHLKVPSLVGSMAAVFSMYIISWVPAGHATKIAVMAFFPYIFLLVERLREKFDWRIALLLILVIHFLFIPAHIQMIFYTYLALGVYFLFYLVRGFVKKEDWKGTFRAGVVLAVATVLAVSMNADQYLSVWEYSPYSMRGSNPIVQAPGGEKTVEGGLAYDYATAWSFGVGEVVTFFVPSWYGFGSTTYQGPLTNNQAIQQNFYFGPEPFTESPQYMGVVILIFAVIGLWRHRKTPFVQYLGLMCAFSLVVAFGKEFPLLYDPMFKYLPMFNKFRGPSMILTLVQILVPILAAYGIASFLEKKEQNITIVAEKKWKYLLAVLGLLFAAGVFVPGMYKSVYSAFIPMQMVADKFKYNPQVVQLIYDFFTDKVATDFLFAFGFLFVAFGAIYGYLHQKLSLNLLACILVVVAIGDLWRIDFQPMNPQPKTDQADIFAAPNYVRFLQQDTTQYRVLQFENGRPPYDNKLAYWKIQSAYGYHGAKMRWYQDIDDVAGIGNPLVWQLMDVKYVISNVPDSSQMLSLIYDGPQDKVYLNRSHIPRAFFVNRYDTTSGVDLLRKMQSMSFDVRDVAYCLDDPHLNIDPPKPGAKAEYVHYGLQDLELKVTATGNNLLFLSESYYPKGWKALVDGRETPIYRLDYLFRGIVVPEGTHKVEMKFESPTYRLGENVSLGMNIVLLGGLGMFGFDRWRKRKAPSQLSPPQT